MVNPHINPNWFAYLALLIWPAVALCLYARLPVGRATLWTILGAYLLLPVGTEIKLQGVPAFNKDSIPNLVALIGCALCTGRLPRFFRGVGIAEILILVLLIGPFITSLNNNDPIVSGKLFIPGVGNYDALSASVTEFIAIIPFFLGRHFLRGPDDNLDVLRILTVAGLAYTVPMLFEIHASPQLHIWIYGYFPTEFYQEVRDGGFRPVVFLGHGLTVAFFALTTVMAAAALWRTQIRIGRWASGGITAYLSVVSVLCKTASTLMYGVILVPLIRWASPRSQLRMASIIAIIALTYPVLRTSDLVPTNSILEAANAVSANRAASLKTRFDNEGALLEHAWQRPWFGWGRYARGRLFNGYMQRDSAVTDGRWIITVSTFGLVGFAAEFGLLALSVFHAARALKFAQTTRESTYLAALALIVAISIFNLLPNDGLSPWTWLLAGTLLGRTEALFAMGGQRASKATLNRPPLQTAASRNSATGQLARDMGNPADEVV